MASKTTLGWVAGAVVAVGGIAGAATQAADWWPSLGWQTPDRHERDMVEAFGKLDDLDRLLRCDKLEERLQRLLHLQRNGDDSIETERQIEVIEQRMEDLRCFEIEY